MPDKALEQLRLVVELDDPNQEFNDLMTRCELAFLEAGYGSSERAEETLSLLRAHARNDAVRLRFALASAEARLFARKGMFAEADAALDQIDMIGLARLFNDMANPIVAKAEVLLLAGRHAEAVDLVDGCYGQLGYLARTRVLAVRAEALAGLGRWADALDAGRRSEESRRRFDIESVPYAELCHPEVVQSPPSPLVIADLYARQIRLRDLLAHDIRGLFNSVVLAFEAVTNGRTGVDYRRALHRMVSLIDALYDVPVNASSYLQLVDGSRRAEVQPVRLSDLATEVVERYSLQAERKGIRLVLEPSFDVHVDADREMLKACLTNLVSNGLKFSSRGQSVVVGWTPLSGLGTEHRSYVEINVSDQGPGLTAEERRQVFRRARIFSAKPTGGEPSSGLGLQIVLGFVDKMSGRVRAETNPSGGSRFVMELALSDVEPTTVARPVMAAQKTRLTVPEAECSCGDSQGATSEAPRRRVLLVDDDPAAVAVLAELIERTGAEARTATSYEEAYEIIRCHTPFALAIFDIMIGDAPLGLDLVRAGRALMPEAAIAVATGLGPSFTDPLLEGCTVLRKPLRFEQVLSLINSLDVPSGRELLTSTGRTQLLGEVAQGRSLSLSELNQLSDRSRSCGSSRGPDRGCCSRGRTRPDQREPRGKPERVDQLKLQEVEVGVDFEWHHRDILGMVHQQSGDLDRARRQLEETLAYATSVEYVYGMPRTAIRLSEVYEALGMTLESVETLVWAARRIGADQAARATVLARLGRSMLVQGDPVLAITQLRLALSNYSPIQVENIRATLRWLFEAYMETNDYDSARVVLARLDRLDPESPSESDRAFDTAGRAALAAADGRSDRAVELAQAALAGVGDSCGGEAATIARRALLQAYCELESYDDAVRTWYEFVEKKVTLGCPNIMLGVAQAMKRLGRLRDAYETERRAYQIRSRQNLFLPTMVDLARELALSQASDAATAERLADEDYTALWARTEHLCETIRELRQVTVDLLDSDDLFGSPSDRAHLADVMGRVGRAVATFDDERTDQVGSGC